jgi:hypothetical protein
MSASSYFYNLNNLAKASLGFKLTTDLNVIDSLRNISTETALVDSGKLPDVYLAYNHLNKGRLLKSNEVLSTSGALDVNESDYLLHNPQSLDRFCSVYSLFKSCSGVDNLQYNLDINGVFNFFEGI